MMRLIETSLGIIRDVKKYSWDVDSESWLDYEEAAQQQTRGGGKDEFKDVLKKTNIAGTNLLLRIY